jgi:hypothetical protein
MCGTCLRVGADIKRVITSFGYPPDADNAAGGAIISRPLSKRPRNAGNEPCMGTFLYCKQEHSVAMANNKNPNQKQPGEKEPGTFHYNPGNMSGKIVGTSKDKSEQKSDADRPHSSSEQPDKKAVDN